MLPPRLSLALDDGVIAAPLAVVGPDPGADLSGLPAPLTLICDRQPDHEGFLAQGFDVGTDIPRGMATVIVHLPRERALARSRIAAAMATGARVLVDGAKTDGIDAMLKACRAQGTVSHVIAKAHGKLFALDGGDFADWATPPSRNADGFWTAPGVFSADGIDPGSTALIAALPPLKGSVADLGAGWGYLSHHILGQADVACVHLVEADRMALDCARRNAGDPRARFHWGDATDWTPPEPVDTVVMNPPFHKGRKGAPDLGRAFIANAARILTQRGVLWMVANRHLPYEAALGDLFADLTEVPGTAAFKLYRAARPRRKR